MQSEAEVDDPFLLLLRKRAIQAREQQGIPFAQGDAAQDWPVRLTEPPTAHEFRQIIEQHVPVLIDGCMTDRPILEKWKDTSYLEKRMGPDRNVVVAVTPDGRADDLIAHPGHVGGKVVFALPLEESMPFSELLDRLSEQVQSKSETIAYLQSQNSNLSVQQYGDLSPLLHDLELYTASHASDMGKERRSDLVWATEAIGYAPEATNLWIGTSSSRTSMHRDYYENLFTVVRGWKEFTVFPPSEACFLCDDEEYPVYKYVKDSSIGQLKLQPDQQGATTRWIPIDPTLPKHADRNAPYVHRDLNSTTVHGTPSRVHNTQTKYGYALPPLRIRVHEGETLYLPSGWFHHVAQQQDQQLVPSDDNGPLDRGLCLCLNWWYEISDEVAIQLEETSLSIPS
ncbi:uncharacterized protein UTRI_00569 [Ustilago trichophora]|uniref:JmjC domain-containing protein n=1 Tax=Ustilago trichophora TaxID=86804 RepID=A0A5C3DSD3_9BASI|nr:uncharacterized protein UTRI_00569 [Ustilago trichophora]